jgi:hypothetical protein
MNDEAARLTSPTEQEMRNTKVPTPATPEALVEYIKSLVEREHDYGTCVYAMSMAAVASFNYVASKLGVTGFQASCADLDILRRTRGLECPFALIKAEDMLYPQYDINGRVKEHLDSWRGWAADEARKKLAALKDDDTVHPAVLKHWKKLAAYTEKNN